MSALSIQPTYPIFTDIDGQPLEDGYIWIGVANLDPQTNPINVYWDAALTLPAGQPIRTLAGYPSNSGTPARLYVDVASSYSIRVMNKNGSVLYGAAAATEREVGANISYSPGPNSLLSDNNVQDALDSLSDESSGSSVVGYDPGLQNTVFRTVEHKLRDMVSVKDFGAVGDGVVDDTTAIQNAINYCHTNFRTLFFPAGTYKITDTLVKASSFYGVNMLGEGATQTILDFSSFAAPAKSGFTLIGGSGSLPNNVIQGFQFKGNQNVRAIEFRGLGGQRVRDCIFENVLVGGLFNNKDPGSFTEFDVFENCRFNDNCWLALEYQRDLGGDSFHGSGLQDCVVGSIPTQLARIRINIGCKPYNSPMTATFFMNSSIPIIEHIETSRAAHFYGHIKVETFAGKAILASGYDVGLAGDVSILGTAPEWGTLTLTRQQNIDIAGVLQSLGSMYVGQPTAINTATPTDIYIPTGMVRGSRLIFVYLQGTFVEASYVLLSLVSPFGFFPAPTLIGKSVADNGGQSGVDPVFSLNNVTSALRIQQGAGPSNDVTARVVVYQLGIGAANNGSL